jgi:hypothetical protein
VSAQRKLAAAPAAPAFQAEHIVLETAEVPSLTVAEARRVRRQFRLENRSRGIATELTLFDKSYLGVRELRRGGSSEEIILDLRHLDPRPVLSRSFATKSLKFALGSLAVSLLVGALAYFFILPALVVVVSAAASLSAGAVALWSFIRRTRNEVTFRTKYGRTAVLTLTANFGCFRACRELVPKIVNAINEAGSSAPDKAQQLRAETREHYRLREIGALSQDDCATGTRRILAQY